MLKKERKKISVIIPAFNEENAIGMVLSEIPQEWVDEVVVVDNNSSDRTQETAKIAGATVLTESIQGYGASCLKGIDYVMNREDPPDIIVFLDADYSDYPQELPKLVLPIIQKNIDLTIGSRELGRRQKGSMTFPQIFGNWFATYLLKKMYHVNYTDLGPFRAIKSDVLAKIDMQDKTYGWTVEMQLKVAKGGFSSIEIPVDYKVRIGESKVSGTIKGTIMAGYKILWTIFKYR